MNRAAWLSFLATPISGDAMALALRLSLDPFDPESAPVNPREFAESLRMRVDQYERAWAELRDPRVGWIHGHHFDRPMLKPDAPPRALVAGIPAPNLDAIDAVARDVIAPALHARHKGNRK